MLGSYPSADAVAWTDRGGCYGIPFSFNVGRVPSSGQASKQ